MKNNLNNNLNNNIDVLELDIVFDSNKNKEFEEIQIFRMLTKVGVAGFISTTVCIFFSLPFYYQTNKQAPSILNLLGMIAIYGTTTTWFFLRLEKEFLLNQYSEQKLNREEKYFKIIKHFLSITLSIVANMYLFSVAYNSSSFVSQETAVMIFIRYSLVFMCCYYFLFNSINALGAWFSKKIAKSVLITEGLAQIIENAIPILMRLTHEERKAVIQEFYNPLKSGVVSLSVLLRQLQALAHKENLSADTIYFRLNSAIPFLAILISIIFVALDFQTPSDSIVNRNQSLIIFYTIMRVPPYVLLNVLTLIKVLHQLLANSYKKESLDVVAHFYPKTCYLILLFAYIVFGLYLEDSINKQKTGDRYLHSVSLENNYITDITFFLEDFLFIHMTFNEVYKSLITNYIAIFGNEEQKDLIRVIGFLTYIKEEVFKKARPDIMNKIINSIEGDALLINLEINKTGVSNKKSFSATFSDFSAKFFNFFSEKNDLEISLIDKKNITHNQLVSLANIGDERDSYGSNP